MHGHCKCGGYSLVELLLVLSIVAVLTAMAAPALTGIAASYRLYGAAEAFAQSLSLTRSEAIKRNARVVMCKSRTGLACETESGWESGWLVFQDSNNDAQLGPAEVVILRHAALPEALAFTSNLPFSAYISYSALGAARYPSGALQMGRFTLCIKSPQPTSGRDFIVGSVGRPRVASRQLDRCPEGPA
jgi:type IV fimbrial biogenesis protein FimT